MGQIRFDFKFHTDRDADIIDKLRSMDNMQDYVRRLIRADAILSALMPEEESSNEERTVVD